MNVGVCLPGRGDAADARPSTAWRRRCRPSSIADDDRLPALPRRRARRARRRRRHPPADRRAARRPVRPGRPHRPDHGGDDLADRGARHGADGEGGRWLPDRADRLGPARHPRLARAADPASARGARGRASSAPRCCSGRSRARARLPLRPLGGALLGAYLAAHARRTVAAPTRSRRSRSSRCSAPALLAPFAFAGGLPAPGARPPRRRTRPRRHLGGLPFPDRRRLPARRRLGAGALPLLQPRRRDGSRVGLVRRIAVCGDPRRSRRHRRRRARVAAPRRWPLSIRRTIV